MGSRSMRLMGRGFCFIGGFSFRKTLRVEIKYLNDSSFFISKTLSSFRLLSLLENASVFSSKISCASFILLNLPLGDDSPFSAIRSLRILFAILKLFLTCFFKSFNDASFALRILCWIIVSSPLEIFSSILSKSFSIDSIESTNSLRAFG